MCLQNNKNWKYQIDKYKENQNFHRWKAFKFKRKKKFTPNVTKSIVL